jgi:hypothetical protein
MRNEELEMRNVNEEMKKCLCDALQKALKGLDSQSERRAALKQLNSYVEHLENVQQMPLLTRLAYWECAYTVFDFLRCNKQLGRTVGPFSDSVRKDVNNVLKNIDFYVPQK